MPLVKTQCSNCGGMIEVGTTAETIKCPFCGTTYVFESSGGDSKNMRRIIDNNPEKETRSLAEQLRNKSEQLSKQEEYNNSHREEVLAKKYVSSILSAVEKKAGANTSVTFSLHYETEYSVSNPCGVEGTPSIFFDKYSNVNFEVIRKNYLVGYDILWEKIDIDLMMSVVERELRKSGFYVKASKSVLIKEIHNKKHYNSTMKLQGYGISVMVDWSGDKPQNKDFTFDNKEIDKSVFEVKKQSTSGCYIATCVYGSYDCPEVWTLRRYRDNTLSHTVFGRAFIKMYYAISPTLVKWFGDTWPFQKFWRNILDKMVAHLHKKGIEDTRYYD